MGSQAKKNRALLVALFSVLLLNKGWDLSSQFMSTDLSMRAAVESPSLSELCQFDEESKRRYGDHSFTLERGDVEVTFRWSGIRAVCPQGVRGSSQLRWDTDDESQANDFSAASTNSIVGQIEEVEIRIDGEEVEARSICTSCLEEQVVSGSEQGLTLGSQRRMIRELTSSLDDVIRLARETHQRKQLEERLAEAPNCTLRMNEDGDGLVRLSAESRRQCRIDALADGDFEICDPYQDSYYSDYYGMSREERRERRAERRRSRDGRQRCYQSELHYYTAEVEPLLGQMIQEGGAHRMEAMGFFQDLQMSGLSSPQVVGSIESLRVYGAADTEIQRAVVDCQRDPDNYQLCLGQRLYTGQLTRTPYGYQWRPGLVPQVDQHLHSVGLLTGSYDYTTRFAGMIQRMSDWAYLNPDQARDHYRREGSISPDGAPMLVAHAPPGHPAFREGQGVLEDYREPGSVEHAQAVLPTAGQRPGAGVVRTTQIRGGSGLSRFTPLSFQQPVATPIVSRRLGGIRSI